jgi:hypothetical protein
MSNEKVTPFGATGPQIYTAITNVMKEIGAIGKTSKNTQQGFMFRGIDAVMNAINPALIKNGIFIVPEILEQTREERQTKSGNNLIYSVCKIKYTFYAQDGSSVEAVVIGEGMDSGDKATNKAMSIAFKYACFQVFCIPTEEMVDPDAECHEVKPKAKKEEKKAAADPVQNVAQAAKISAKEVVELMQSMETNKVYIETIRELYKVRELEDLTPKQFDNIRLNWGKIIERQKNKVAQGN